MWNPGYGGLTLKLYLYFQLCGGSMPESSTLFKCQQYVIQFQKKKREKLLTVGGRPENYVSDHGTTQFSSVAQSCPSLCNPINCSMPGLPGNHQLPESTQTHVHWVSDAIQPSHPLSSLSSPALNLSQHQGLFKWVSSSHQVAKVVEFELQHQSFQWTPRTDLL